VDRVNCSCGIPLDQLMANTFIKIETRAIGKDGQTSNWAWIGVEITNKDSLEVYNGDDFAALVNNNWNANAAHISEAYNFWNEPFPKAVREFADLGSSMDVSKFIAVSADYLWAAKENVNQLYREVGIIADGKKASDVVAEMRTKVAETNPLLAGITVQDYRDIVAIINNSRNTASDSAHEKLGNMKDAAEWIVDIKDQLDDKGSGELNLFTLYANMVEWSKTLDDQSTLAKIIQNTVKYTSDGGQPADAEEAIVKLFDDIIKKYAPQLDKLPMDAKLVEFNKFMNNSKNMLEIAGLIIEIVDLVLYYDTIKCFGDVQIEQLKLARNGTQNTKLKTILNGIISDMESIKSEEYFDEFVNDVLERGIEVGIDKLSEKMLEKGFPAWGVVKFIIKLASMMTTKKMKTLIEYLNTYDLTIAIKTALITELKKAPANLTPEKHSTIKNQITGYINMLKQLNKSHIAFRNADGTSYTNYSYSAFEDAIMTKIDNVFVYAPK